MTVTRTNKTTRIVTTPNNRGTHDFTVEQVEWLTMQCKGDLSYRDISVLFNERFRTGLTRNSILGKCTRLGLRETKPDTRNRKSRETRRKAGVSMSTRVSPNTIIGRYKTHKALASAATAPPPARDSRLLRDEGDRGQAVQRSGPVDIDTVFDDTVSTAKPFLELRRGECKWPASNDASMACGAPATIGTYCTCHAQRAFRAMPTKSRNQRVLAGAGLLDMPDEDGGTGAVITHMLENGGVHAPLAIPSFLK
jgi:hypothetical protein